MNERIEKELYERYFRNGKYCFKASEEYKQKKLQKQTEVKGESLSSVIRNSIKKLDAIDKAFGIAETRGKKVSHISHNKFILI